MAEVSKVWVEDDECISCEECVSAAPDVFEMDDDTAKVKPAAAAPEFCKEHSDAIVEAAETCPVDSIKYE